MRVDVYRNRSLEKILIVKAGADIKVLFDEGSAFIRRLEFIREIDMEADKLPIYLKKDEAYLAIETNGFHIIREESEMSLLPN